MNSIKISYIVPIYNVEHYIKECIDSILAQTIEDIEVIAINDGSTDGSSSVLSSCYSNNPRVTILSQENLGQGKTRNRGISLARGKYIQFVDSDDTIDSEMGKLLYNEAERSNADIVFCAYQNINTYKGKTYVRHIDPDLFNTDRMGNTCLLLHRSQLFSPIWNKLYRTEHIRNHQFKAIEPCEDVVFNLEELCITKRIAYVDEPLYHFYSRGSSSITHSYRNQLMTPMSIAYNTWNEFFNQQGEEMPEYKLFLDGYRFSAFVNLTKNLYRYGSPYRFGDRTQFIREEIIGDPEFQDVQIAYKNCDSISRLFIILSKMNSAWLMNICFTLLYAVQRKVVKKA